MSVLRQSLQAGSAAFGAWQCLPSSLSAEILARSGFDWILIDLQHGGASWSDLLSIVQAVELGGAIPMVRLGWNDPMQVMRALDLGACGVVIPMISTPEDARQGAASCRYPPHGMRSFGPTRSFYSARTLNNAALCLAMIETKEGLDSVDAIAATPGIDGLFVGTMDLALGLGCGLVAGVNGTLLGAIDQVVAACTRHRKIPGGVAVGDGTAEQLLAHGMRFLADGSDIGYLEQGAKRDAQKTAAWVKGICSTEAGTTPASVQP
jgi:4-hydroxy-2-oxoheptanedioate aldolase